MNEMFFKNMHATFPNVYLLHTQKSVFAQLAFLMVVYFFGMQNFKKIRGQVVVAALCISGVAITAIGNSASSVSAAGSAAGATSTTGAAGAGACSAGLQAATARIARKSERWAKDMAMNPSD